MKHQIIKVIICTAVLFGVSLNVFAQDARKDNYFADIKSINLFVNLTGDFDFCNVRDSDIRSAVGYTLANSPLKKIDKNSLDIFYINVTTMKMTGDRGTLFGCGAYVGFELVRFVNFKGIDSLVTVWSTGVLQRGTENSLGRQVNSLVERTTKEFVGKWAEQN